MELWAYIIIGISIIVIIVRVAPIIYEYNKYQIEQVRQSKDFIPAFKKLSEARNRKNFSSIFPPVSTTPSTAQTSLNVSVNSSRHASQHNLANSMVGEDEKSNKSFKEKDKLERLNSAPEVMSRTTSGNKIQYINIQPNAQVSGSNPFSNTSHASNSVFGHNTQSGTNSEFSINSNNFNSNVNNQFQLNSIYDPGKNNIYYSYMNPGGLDYRQNKHMMQSFKEYKKAVNKEKKERKSLNRSHSGRSTPSGKITPRLERSNTTSFSGPNYLNKNQTNLAAVDDDPTSPIQESTKGFLKNLNSFGQKLSRNTSLVINQNLSRFQSLNSENNYRTDLRDTN